MAGNLSAIYAIRLVEIRTAETQSGRRWDAPRKLIYVMALVRSRWGINKEDGVGATHVQIISTDALRRL